MNENKRLVKVKAVLGEVPNIRKAIYVIDLDCVQAAGESGEHGEYEVIMKDGSPIWLEEPSFNVFVSLWAGGGGSVRTYLSKN
jgi:hypothetical protein